MISIDGSIGEGGGQVLRTAVSLSLVTGQPIRISNIRQGRKNPGLQAQHLAAVRIATEISEAEVIGAELNSKTLLFSPKKVTPGKYHCQIKTAGSTSLALQTVYLPLSFCEKSSRLSISGGTHAAFAPSFDFLSLHWAYYLNSIGFKVALGLEQAGFFPQGGGLIDAQLSPAGSIRELDLIEPGPLKQIRGISAIANLDRTIAERQRQRVIHRLGNKYRLNDIRIRELPSNYKGTTLCLVCEFENSQCCYFSLGARGKPAEKVADEVCDQIEYLMSTNAALDEYIADQLLLPLAFGKNTSVFSTAKITRHLITNAEIIQIFTPARIKISGDINQPGTVSIKPQ